MRADVGPIDLSEIVEQSVEYAAAAFNARGITCEVQGPSPMIVTADALLVGQALLNLLLNAAEAIDGPGTVSVRYRKPGPDETELRQFQVVVQDSGPGIPAEVLDRVFNPFFTTKETGTGLGLSIVHRIVEAHDGTIIAGNAPGGGARFEVRV